jgi:hypothetical protein
MSNRFPPQLHLSLPPAATSFKRSFDQFGFDLDSPGLQDSQGAGGSGSSSSASTPSTDGNDRNKRARSEPRSTESTPDVDLSALPSFLDPPRLATPDLPDLDMTTATTTTAPLDLSDRLRLSLDRFNAFDTQISVLRAPRSRSPNPPSPPPTLPPLSLDDRVHLNELPNPFTFQSIDSAPSSAPYLPFGSPASPQPANDNNDHHNDNDNDIQPHELHAEGTLDPRGMYFSESLILTLHFFTLGHRSQPLRLPLPICFTHIQRRVRHYNPFRRPRQHNPSRQQEPYPHNSTSTNRAGAPVPRSSRFGTRYHQIALSLVLGAPRGRGRGRGRHSITKQARRNQVHPAPPHTDSSRR